MGAYDDYFSLPENRYVNDGRPRGGRQGGYKTGWSANGVLRTPAFSGERLDGAVKLQADFGESAADYYTLQFNLVNLDSIDPSTATDEIVIRALAEINWSVEGNFVRRLVHVTSGVSISGLGQAASIKIIDDSEVGDVSNSVRYTASVQVTKGTRPTLGGTQPPILSPRIFLPTTDDPNPTPPPYRLVPGDDMNIPVPVDAGVNSVLVAVGLSPGSAPPTGVITDVSMVQRAGIAPSFPGFVLVSHDYNSFNKFIPLVPGCFFVRVFNEFTENVFITPIFGIEG